MPDNKEKFEQLNQVIAELKDQPGALMPVMQRAQNIFGCVSLDVQKVIAEGLGVTLSEVYGVATFYSQFKLNPNGEYSIAVCLGTACYVKGSQAIIDEISKELSVEVGSTSPDGKYSLEATRCIGACGLAPVMTVNGDVYGRVTKDQIPGILKKYC